jgi:hypothetical protein
MGEQTERSTHSTAKKGGVPKKRPKFHEWRPVFIESLREFGVITYAAEIAGINRTTAYVARNRNQKFAEEWDEALQEATDALELEARRRAVAGVQRLKFHKGDLIMIPLFDEDGRIVYEDMTDYDGKLVLDKNGRVRRTPVMVPYVEHDYSDTLLIFLLKCWRPEYRDNTLELRTRDGQPLSQTNISVFKNLSDDELYDAITGAMAQIAASPDGEAGSTDD